MTMTRTKYRLEIKGQVKQFIADFTDALKEELHARYKRCQKNVTFFHGTLAQLQETSVHHEYRHHLTEEEMLAAAERVASCQWTI